jgi:carbon storage regulator CsrA
MLVLSRTIGQGITLSLPSGEMVKFKVLTYKGPHTQVGIIAPKSILILRDELIDKNKEISD